MMTETMSRADQQRALSTIYEAEVDRVYGYAVNRVGRDEAADVAAEVFHAAALAFRDGNGDTVTRSWLLAVAHNKVMDHWRRAYRRKATAHLTHRRSSDMTDFPDDWTADPRREGVLDALDALPERDRSLLVLHHVDGLPVAQLAELLGKSDRAIESALARARRRFRRHYEGGDR